jgi:3-oxoacyl-[acyl-carrier protein] reductase
MTKTVIVTGAAGGMGLEVLRILAQQDVNVACVDLDESQLSQAIAGLGETRGEFLAFGADVSDEAAVARYVGKTVEGVR